MKTTVTPNPAMATTELKRGMFAFDHRDGQLFIITDKGAISLNDTVHNGRGGLSVERGMATWCNLKPFIGTIEIKQEA